MPPPRNQSPEAWLVGAIDDVVVHAILDAPRILLVIHVDDGVRHPRALSAQSRIPVDARVNVVSDGLALDVHVAEALELPLTCFEVVDVCFRIVAISPEEAILEAGSVVRQAEEIRGGKPTTGFQNPECQLEEVIPRVKMESALQRNDF